MLFSKFPRGSVLPLLKNRNNDDLLYLFTKKQKILKGKKRSIILIDYLLLSKVPFFWFCLPIPAPRTAPHPPPPPPISSLLHPTLLRRTYYFYYPSTFLSYLINRRPSLSPHHNTMARLAREYKECDRK
jgi:hypothetical protein